MRALVCIAAALLPVLASGAPPAVSPSSSSLGATSPVSPVPPAGTAPAIMTPQNPVVSEGGVALPGVRFVDRDRSAASRSDVPQHSEGGGETEAPGNSESEKPIVVKPGATELVRIAKGYLNRIVTPFPDPKVLSANDLDVKREGASLFIATNSDQPVGIFILPQDPRDARSISLTLIPSRIPPKTIELQWPGAVLSALAPEVAQRWEEADPYVDTLLALAEKVALGEVPDGYALSAMTGPVPCALPGVTFEPGQQLTGNHFTVYVARATNRTRTQIELEGHAGCEVKCLAMIAPWPRAVLDPAASTELYIGVRSDLEEEEARAQTRPSLLSDADGRKAAAEARP
jgi:conjugal transfer pilus assembly protein TraK